MGDLAVGARSGSGEPEDGNIPAGSVQKTAGGGAAPDAGHENESGHEPPAPRSGAGDGGPGSGGEGPGEDDGAAGRRRRPERKQRSFWKELPLLIGIALVLALLIKTFLVQAFSIPSDSMQNTLQEGDRVLVDKLTPWFGSEPDRGEVVVFHDPGGWLPENPPASGNAVSRGLQSALSFIGLMPSAQEKDLIKRVIGVGGDTVECNGTGPLKVNGKALVEPYVYPDNTPCTMDKPFKVTVPKDRIWVMGDHRQNSLDSRYHMDQPGNGFVPLDDVVGRAFVKAWPINRWGMLPVPDTFDQPGINATGALPAAAGLVGAVPLVLMRRRRLTRKGAEAAEGSAS